MRRNSFFCAAAAAFCCVLLLSSCVPSTAERTQADETLSVNDTPYVWVFNYGEDMQLPELPTGCEATAAATLLRMNGVPVTKTEMADALPKSDADFVNAFLGDPYSETGWTCSAPCITETINGFLESEEDLAAVELTGTALADLPTPCTVWVSIDLADVSEPVRTQDGYGLFRNPHCVTITAVGEAEVSCIDPLRGDTTYERSQFEKVFNAMGMQSVYVTDVLTALQLMDERGVG